MSSQSKPKKILTEESVEAKSRVSEPTTLSEEAKQAANDAIKKSWEQMFGGLSGSISEQLLGSAEANVLAEGQEISLSKQNKNADVEKSEKRTVTSEHLEYFRTVQNVERVGETKTESEVKQAVEQIRIEIKRLTATSKIVERTVKDATADKAPVKPGKYHLNFFQFVLSMLREATRKLEDSASYGALFTSKKQQSKYWNSYKKHGTTFGLSGERTTATQTG